MNPMDSEAALAEFPETLDGASDLQRELATRVVEAPLASKPCRVAGADLSYDRASGLLFAAVVLMDERDRSVKAVGRYVGPTSVPYVPGFLSFREGPAVVRALETLPAQPDLLLCDGQGRAHPRRFGLACHLGVALDLPTVGVAKSRLVGVHREPGPSRGASVRLTDRGEQVGLVVRTRDRVRPVYVSVGHRVDLDGARRTTLRWARPYRIPEPIRLAHHEVNAMRRAELEA